MTKEHESQSKNIFNWTRMSHIQNWIEWKLPSAKFVHTKGWNEQAMKRELYEAFSKYCFKYFYFVLICLKILLLNWMGIGFIQFHLKIHIWGTVDTKIMGSFWLDLYTHFHKVLLGGILDGRKRLCSPFC